ncbi:conserved hypothetical protein [Actinomyces sp. oral taxon 180 str. F0310]|nr:conserved hypothetical protein [Actinomyces sp. oral taxon 180 str. F0310]
MRTLQRHGWMSDQHGAWAMMALPPLLGWALSGRLSWFVLLLLVAWAMAFQLFSATCLWVKTPAKRRGRILPALATYGVATAIPGVALLVSRPQLLWWGCAFVPLASCALFLVWQGRERSLAARAASILAGSVMGPVAFSLASADGSPVAVSAHAWAACAIFASYYVGTVPLVRSMIRGRRDPRWSLGATAYHAACTAATAIAWWFAVVSPWCVLAWVALTARAWAMPALSRARKRPLSPRLIGLTEMAWTCLLFATLLLP